MWTDELIFSEGDINSISKRRYEQIINCEIEERKEHVERMIKRLEAELETINNNTFNTEWDKEKDYREKYMVISSSELGYTYYTSNDYEECERYIEINYPEEYRFGEMITVTKEEHDEILNNANFYEEEI